LLPLLCSATASNIARFSVQKERQIMARRQQQKLLFAGGALAALGLVWYYKQRQQRQRKRSYNEPRDLLLEEEEMTVAEEQQLKYLFGEAAKEARKLGKLNQRDQLMMYGLYKQAVEGDRTGDPVSLYASWLV